MSSTGTPPRKLGAPIRMTPEGLFPEQVVNSRTMGRGIRGTYLFLGTFAIVTLGHWKVSRSMTAMRLEEKEEMEARTNILGVIAAESDREFLRARARELQIEEKYAADIPGFVVGETPYNTRWMAPEKEVEGNW
eukprot:TRINITY_DN5671_c0_g1_i1.p1 TRINITY_DN5671_c0_g1~~TRINITY_DN5671_c0_g1_i1.p1  ORF type:complete len:134 (+),score=30.13 TRINITY_DN5671_c0_g1_i1:88-489(+)